MRDCPDSKQGCCLSEASNFVDTGATGREMTLKRETFNRAQGIERVRRGEVVEI